MAARIESAVYSPYGAYELKAKYQKNFLLSTILVTSFFILVTGTYLIVTYLGGEEAIDLTGKVIKTVADLGPPPSVAHTPPQVQVQQPDISLPKVGIPKPVADDEIIDEDVVLATKEEMAEITVDITATEGEGIVVDIQDDFIPAFGEFVPVENPPELIYKHQEAYPRLAKQAGLEGTVHLNVLVMKDGSVRDAKVVKSSGIASLDEKALEWVYKCTFKPGIQNGRPVNCWVGFSYDFRLTKN